MQVALRVASPGLKEDFKENIEKYTPVLKDFLRRQSPAMRTWLDDVGWSVDGDRILLTCPDDFAIVFFRRYALDEKLSQAVWDIFRLRMPVALVKCGEREAWVTMMRAETARRREQELAEARAQNPHAAALPPEGALGRRRAGSPVGSRRRRDRPVGRPARRKRATRFLAGRHIRTRQLSGGNRHDRRPRQPTPCHARNPQANLTALCHTRFANRRSKTGPRGDGLPPRGGPWGRAPKGDGAEGAEPSPTRLCPSASWRRIAAS